MKPSAISSMIAAAAIAMAGAGTGAAQIINAREHAPRSKRPGRPSLSTATRRSRSVTYPDQSRRQQGGPGIVLSNKNVYEAATA